jgi:hypothetical protein
MQDSERRCRFNARPKSLTGQGVQPRSVTPQGSWETGTNPSNRPLKAVAWVQIPSGLRRRSSADAWGILLVAGRRLSRDPTFWQGGSVGLCVFTARAPVSLGPRPGHIRTRIDANQRESLRHATSSNLRNGRSRQSTSALRQRPNCPRRCRPALRRQRPTDRAPTTPNLRVGHLS